MNKRTKLIIAGLILLLEIGLLLWIRGRYESVLSHGDVFEAPASVDFKADFFNENYLGVNLPFDNAVWIGQEKPSDGERIYLIPGKDVDGAMIIKQAQDNKPASGDYVVAHAAGYDGEKVYFHFPADRVYMTSDQMKKLSVLELSERVQTKDAETKTVKTRMKNKITAIVRIEDGHAVIERLLANGSPVELAYTTIGINEKVTYANSDKEKDVITYGGEEVSDDNLPSVDKKNTKKDKAGMSVKKFLFGE